MLGALVCICVVSSQAFGVFLCKGPVVETVVVEVLTDDFCVCVGVYSCVAAGTPSSPALSSASCCLLPARLGSQVSISSASDII
jgi:hypothetical protein